MTIRHQAREAALQVLYFCQVSQAPAAEAIEAVFAEHLPDAPDSVKTFATRLVHGAASESGALDALIEQQAQNWRLERLAVLDRLILRMAIWELQHELETPAPVVINEALELARTFSSDDSVRFVNGVLDGIRKTLGREA